MLIVPEQTRQMLELIAQVNGIHWNTQEAREAFAREYIRVTPHRCVARSHERRPEVVKWDAQRHPRGIKYWVGAQARTVAHLLDHPSRIAMGWSAAVLHGVRDFSDGLDASFYSLTGTAGPAANALGVSSKRLQKAVSTQPTQLGGQVFRATTPAVTVVDCLLDIRAGEVDWYAATVPELAHADVMSVQIIDAFLRFTLVTKEEIREASRNRLAKKAVMRLLHLADSGTDSKPETILRLHVWKVAAQLGLKIRTQVTVKDVNGRIVTTFDVAIVGLKKGFFYDGEHHQLDRTQAKKDADIMNALQRLGWHSMRVTSQGMKNPDLLREQIREFLVG